MSRKHLISSLDQVLSCIQYLFLYKSQGHHVGCFIWYEKKQDLVHVGCAPTFLTQKCLKLAVFSK